MEVHPMKHESRFHRISMRVHLDLQPFSAHDGRYPRVSVHSSLRPHELSAGHPHIAQRKQCHQLRGVLGQSLVANFGEAELALDDPKRVFDLGTNTRLQLLGLVQQTAPGRIFVQCPAFTRTHMATCQSTPVASGRLVAP